MEATKTQDVSIDLYVDHGHDISKFLDVIRATDSPLYIVGRFEEGAYMIFRESRWDWRSNYIYKMRYLAGIGEWASDSDANARLQIDPSGVMHDVDGHLVEDPQRFSEIARFLETKGVDHYFIARNKEGKIIFIRGYSSEVGRVTNEEIGEDISRLDELLG
jgi:hypothetical protein